ncbi:MULTISPECIES: hypothetical protein [Bradyrhizobium]|uniref:hypothetical protein n=1 Tax=Bradyrhizobium TaxID=374 RepID=UPI000306558E|nr:hypothetical protein [Bradyrhizobium japonicum]MCS3541713.1 hypothetical protein [Bradyrhizobium japonicum]MCS3991101.1 hypothetical protein [Bradyrhizobium japonicum]MCS4014089.1 hypothetical protein [Bradyrhizobium japonicum]MCS4210094.1 hypothetical protein [Bradyrhizobium japonicum]MDH6171433.1 hypothetical protein [Bradyrhizobium japonicum]
MATIERQYLPPLNPETTIAEADRPRVYDIVRKQLADLLEGDQSYYPDGVQKDWQARAEDLDGYIRSFTSLQGRVNDPADILGDVIRHLRGHAKNFRTRIEGAGPSDPIELPPALSPTTRDRNELYVYPNPFAPPMETLPQPRREWPVSSGAGIAKGSGTSKPEQRIAPPIFFPF